jgi:hypothetical protein
LHYSNLELTQVPAVVPGDEGFSLTVSSCLGVYPEDRPQSFSQLATMLARALHRPPVRATVVPLPEVDQQRRELALSRVLIRLGHLDDAVNRLNRLLARPVSREVFVAAAEAARETLIRAGRHAEAATLVDRR